MSKRRKTRRRALFVLNAPVRRFRRTGKMYFHSSFRVIGEMWRAGTGVRHDQIAMRADTINTCSALRGIWGRAIIKPAIFAGAAFLALGATQASAGGDGFIDRSVSTPDWLSISGSHRTRVELLDGPNIFGPSAEFADSWGRDVVIDNRVLQNLGLSDKPVALASLQTALLVEARTDRFNFVVELLDARSYKLSSDPFDSCNVLPCFPIIQARANAVEPIQSYATINLDDLIGSGALELQLGRFTMDIGSRRLVGRSKFRNYVQSFYGARSDLTFADDDRLTLFYTFPAINRSSGGVFQPEYDNEIKFDVPRSWRRFWGGIYSANDLTPGLNGELFLYGKEEDGNYGTQILWTPGLRIYSPRKPGQFDFEVEGAAQVRKSGRGFFAHAEAGRSFVADNTDIRLSGLFDIASGFHSKYAQADFKELFGGPIKGIVGLPTKLRPFDSLYGVSEDDFLPEGLFELIQRKDIVTPGAKIEASMSDRFDVALTYRALMRLGPEVNLFGDVRISPIIPIRSVSTEMARRSAGVGHLLYASADYVVVPDLLVAQLGAAFFVQNSKLLDPLFGLSQNPAVTDRPGSRSGYFHFALQASF